jgi:uncharacterized protein (DUF2235 family)
MKNIVICADGTWNRPETDIRKDYPTNVLRMARAIAPVADDGAEQVVFDDWGLGSYHDEFAAGALGQGINKNIQDCYRFIVQNYALGDRLYFFGFSRGAFTVRSLSGLLNNCGILKPANARLIARAFEIYKDTAIKPDDDFSRNWRNRNSVRADVSKLPGNAKKAYTLDGHPRVHFVGVWDTVGALGVPLSLLGFLNKEHMFHDNKIGPNIVAARHALAIDERRDDFKPTIWKQRPGVDIQQVWFAGCHADIGGGLKPDEDGSRLSDYPLQWIAQEASARDLKLADHLEKDLNLNKTAQLNESYTGKWLLAGEHKRSIRSYFDIHQSVKDRYDADSRYRPEKLVKRLGTSTGWGELVR